jgi:hypothetical protein
MDYRTDWPLVAVTGLLALATFLLVLATYLLVRGADQSSQKELEAYVYVNPREAFHIDGQGTLQAYSVIGNSGLTPATNVQRSAGIEVLPPTGAITQPTLREAGKTVIGPRSEIALVKNWAHGQLSADQYQQIRRGDLRVYVFGTVFYDDVFGHHWESDFCNSYYGEEGLDHIEPTNADPKHTSFGYEGWQAKPCEHGNEITQRDRNAQE